MVDDRVSHNKKQEVYENDFCNKFALLIKHDDTDASAGDEPASPAVPVKSKEVQGGIERARSRKRAQQLLENTTRNRASLPSHPFSQSMSEKKKRVWTDLSFGHQRSILKWSNPNPHVLHILIAALPGPGCQPPGQRRKIIGPNVT